MTARLKRLVVVAPLKPGAYERAKELVAEGPPFDLAGTSFERHDVFLTRREVVFVFAGPDVRVIPEELIAGSAMGRAAAAWKDCLAERPRIADEVFSWARSQE
jgi:hypothetical protein